MNVGERILINLSQFEKIKDLGKLSLAQIYVLQDLIKKRYNTMKFLNQCYEDYIKNLYSLTINRRETINKDPKFIHKVNDFRNLLALINVADSINERDDIFINVIENLNSELEPYFRDYKKDDEKKKWDELKHDIKTYWNNTKKKFEEYRKKTILWRNELGIILKKINEYDPN